MKVLGTKQSMRKLNSVGFFPKATILFFGGGSRGNVENFFKF